MKDMITRKEYMGNASKLHHKYYSQFVTESTKRFVEREIGLDKIKKSNDKHLNDVVPYFPDYNGGNGPMWLWDLAPVNEALIRGAGENMSQSIHTCVAKAAARILIEEEEA